MLTGDTQSWETYHTTTDSRIAAVSIKAEVLLHSSTDISPEESNQGPKHRAEKCAPCRNDSLVEGQWERMKVSVGLLRGPLRLGFRDSPTKYTINAR